MSVLLVHVTTTLDPGDLGTPPPETPLNGSRPATAGMPVPPRRPRNTIWMVAGIALVLISGIAAASAISSLDDRVEVLVAARTIAEGAVVEDGDLRTASIAVDSGIRAIPPEEAAELIGQVAAGPVGEGSIVHRSQFVAGDAEGQPKVIVGLDLTAGQYPLAGLRPGDRVKVIEVSGANAAFVQDSGAGASTGPRELAEGEVVDVVRLANNDRRLVSLRVSEAIASPLSERAHQGRIRLALIDDGLFDDAVAPLEPADPGQPGSTIGADE